MRDGRRRKKIRGERERERDRRTRCRVTVCVWGGGAGREDAENSFSVGDTRPPAVPRTRQCSRINQNGEELCRLCRYGTTTQCGPARIHDRRRGKIHTAATSPRRWSECQSLAVVAVRIVYRGTKNEERRTAAPREHTLAYEVTRCDESIFFLLNINKKERGRIKSNCRVRFN